MLSKINNNKVQGSSFQKQLTFHHLASLYKANGIIFSYISENWSIYLFLLQPHKNTIKSNSNNVSMVAPCLAYLLFNKFPMPFLHCQLGRITLSIMHQAIWFWFPRESWSHVLIPRESEYVTFILLLETYYYHILFSSYLQSFD